MVRALHGERAATGSPLPFVPALAASASGAPGVGSGGTIFYDGFEQGPLPAWTVDGNPTWANVNYRAAAGQWSAYCAGSAINPPGPYANNMAAWLVAGPFDLSAVTSATFNYKVYFNTESNKDWIDGMVSINGESFYGSGSSGNSQGWENRSIDLTNVATLGNVCGRSQVWIAFRFESDPAIVYEGAYVDEVSVVSSSSPTPTPGADDDIPGVAIPASPFTGSVSDPSDLDDVFSVALTAGQTLTASITGPSGADFRLYLYAPGTASVKEPNTPYVATVDPDAAYPRSFSYSATQSGVYYLDVYAETGAGSYTVTYSSATGGGEAKLVLTADRTTVPYHGWVNLAGVLQDATSGSLLPNREVTWYAAQDIKLTGSWIPQGTETSTTGEYSQRFWLDKLTWFAFTFGGDGQYPEGVSNWVQVKARAKVTPPAVPSRVRAYALITSWGTIKPAHTAAQNMASHTKVYAQHFLGGKWGRAISFFANAYRNVPSGGDPTETQYSLSLRWAPGQWRVWAVHQDAEHLKSTSSWRMFTAY